MPEKKEESKASDVLLKEKPIKGGKTVPICQQMLKTGKQCNRTAVSVNNKSLGYCRVHLRSYPKLMEKYVAAKTDHIKCNGGGKQALNFSLYSEKVFQKLNIDIDAARKHPTQVSDMSGLIIVMEGYLNLLLENFSQSDLKKYIHKIATLMDSIGRQKKNYNDIQYAEKNSILIADFKVIMFALLSEAMKFIKTDDDQRAFLQKFGEMSKSWREMSIILQQDKQTVMKTLQSVDINDDN